MSIQVASSVHAAVTLYVIAEKIEAKSTAGAKPKQYLQSPQGCILQRVPIKDDGNAWIVLLDQALDSSSTALSIVPFASVEHMTELNQGPALPILFHIDDRTKLLIFATEHDGRWKAADQSFHAMFMNYQSNSNNELYPVDPAKVPGNPYGTDLVES